MNKAYGQLLWPRWASAITVTSALCSGAVQADDQRLYRSPAYLGRGDAGIATADNHEAIFYNPAGIAWGKGLYKETVLVSPMLEISTSTKDLIREVVVEKNSNVDSLRHYIGKPQHVAAQNFTGVVFRRAALGAYVRTETNALVFKDPEQGGLEQISAEAIGQQAVVFSVAEGFWQQSVLLGVTAKYLNKQYAAVDFAVIDAKNIAKELKEDDVLKEGAGGGADIGLMLRDTDGTPMSLGLTVENVGNTAMASADGNEAVPTIKQTINVGVAAEPGTKVSRIGIHADYRDVTGAVIKNPLKRTHLGVELKIKRMLSLNAGLNQGYPAVGLTLNLYLLRLDIGTYSEEVSERVGTRPDTRAFMRIMAGF